MKLWHEHTGKKATSNTLYNSDEAPRINFKNYMVVAIFQGSGFNNAGVELHSVTQEGNILKVRFKNRGFQTAGIDGGGQKVTPYGIFVLPRSDQKIILEEDVHMMIGDPPLWEERARL